MIPQKILDLITNFGEHFDVYKRDYNETQTRRDFIDQFVKQRDEAIEKTNVPQNEELICGDDIYDLYDCIKIERIDSFYINLNFTDETKEIVSTNVYIKVK